jgi:hypothetical protein
LSKQLNKLRQTSVKTLVMLSSNVQFKVALFHRAVNEHMALSSSGVFKLWHLQNGARSTLAEIV